MDNLENSQTINLSSENPVLVGLLVDVSGSMNSSIQNESGSSLNRLQSFQHSLRELGEKSQTLSGRHRGLIKIFAYGFGFGNLLSFLSNDRGPQVRDLLNKSEEKESTITLDYLADHWTSYQDHIHRLAQCMFGSTPMWEGFQKITDRFQLEWEKHKKIYSSILFVLSDGEPTDKSPESIVKLAENLKSRGVLIVSCFVTSTDITKPRHLYGGYQESWSQGARLMFDCASELPTDSEFGNYMREHCWTVEEKGRLFTQVNQFEILSEFLGIVVSPINQLSNTRANDSFNNPTLSGNPILSDSKLEITSSTTRETSSVGEPKLPIQRESLEGNDEFSQSIHPFSVFLSHSSADKETVFKVIEAFKKAKILYWVDHEQIRFGDPIVDKIEEGLQKSKYVVVCLSEKLINSGWCRAEYGAILYREFSGDTSRRVIPLSLDGSNNSSGIPLLLSDKLRADFTNPNNFLEFIQFLQESRQ